MCDLPYSLCNEDGHTLLADELEKPALAIIASDSRKEEAAEAVAKHWGALSKDFHLLATEGTYGIIRNTLERCQVPNVSNVERLPPKTHGILELAYRVTVGVCRVVIAFADLDDVSLLRPYHRALSRMCVVKGATVLHTEEALDTYLGTVPARRQRLPGIKKAFADAFVNRPEWLRPHRKASLALVAHDGRKTEMVAFAMEYRPHLEDIVSNGGRLLATGTTGDLVQKYAKVPVVRYESGPRGGDVQIAHEARRGRCNGIVFFMDPLSSHPHIEDIYALTESSKIFCPMGTDFPTGKAVLDDVRMRMN
jgi:methylglyoxal synthase